MRRLAVLAVLLVIVLGVLFLPMLFRKERVSQDNFERIVDGMTVAEVEGLFGRRPKMKTLPPYVPEGADIALTWVADDGAWAIVSFKDGAVMQKVWMDQE